MSCAKTLQILVTRSHLQEPQDAQGNDQRDHPEEAGGAMGHGHRGWQGSVPHRQAGQN